MSDEGNRIIVAAAPPLSEHAMSIVCSELCDWMTDETPQEVVDFLRDESGYTEAQARQIVSRIKFSDKSTRQQLLDTVSTAIRIDEEILVEAMREAAQVDIEDVRHNTAAMIVSLCETVASFPGSDYYFEEILLDLVADARELHAGRPR
jgi:hypothetical protein